MQKIIDKVRSLPHNPGIYKFVDAHGHIIYVGKAKSLADRVSQYFQNNLKDGKTRQLVENVVDLDFIEVFSEIEALILEAELIKKYCPKYNINLKDDKSYIYIVIRKELGFRKVITARKSDILKSDTSFGPFPDSSSAKYIVRTIRRMFPFRDCSKNKFIKYKKLGSPCLYGHIGLCSSPCVERVDTVEYNKRIKNVTQFLHGKQKIIIRNMQKRMAGYSKKMEYEKAGEVRKDLQRFEYIQQSFRAPREFMENPYLVDDIYDMALKELVSAVPILKNPPKRIECFDVANISGKDAAVSMIVAVDGRLEKHEYKKFKIRLKETPDDVFMLREALTRRFLHEVRGDLSYWGIPDLIIVDGGKGQVSAATDVLKSLNLIIPVIGLAKKEETIIYQQDNEFKDLELIKSSEALKFLQRLRDESHRFAQVYHHYLRSRQALL